MLYTVGLQSCAVSDLLHSRCSPGSQSGLLKLRLMRLLQSRRPWFAAALLLVLLSAGSDGTQVTGAWWQVSRWASMGRCCKQVGLGGLGHLCSPSRLLPSSCDQKACHCAPIPSNSSSKLGVALGSCWRAHRVIQADARNYCLVLLQLLQAPPLI